MLRKLIKNTALESFLKESFGDWRYPWMVLCWKLAAFLVPRRRVKIGGLEFTLSCHNWITHFRWFLFQKKEVEVQNFIDQYVNENDVFFDIGANVGVFSIYAAKRFKKLSVYSFEPEFSNLNLLKENVIANQLSAFIHIYGLAISNFIGMSYLYLQDFTAGAACHTESLKSLRKTDEGFLVMGREGVMAVTLDYICEQLNICPNVMKIDTDGNEDKIFNGANKTLRNKELRSLIFESPLDQGKKEECHRILEMSGFRLEWHDRQNTRNEIWMRA